MPRSVFRRAGGQPRRGAGHGLRLALPGVEQHVEILDAELQRFPAIGQQEGGSRVDAGGGTGAHLRIDLLEAEFDIDVIRAVRVPDDLDGQAVGEGQDWRAAMRMVSLAVAGSAMRSIRISAPLA